MKKWLFCLLMCTVLLFTFAAQAAEQIVVEVAHMFAEGDPNTIAVEEGKAYIEEKTGGRITFRIYPNGIYGEQQNSIQAVRMGTLDVFNGGFGSDIYPPAGAIQGPYLFRDYEHWRTFKKSDVCREIITQLETLGSFKAVGVGHFGFRETITVTPAQTVEDFKKLKLRVVNAPPYPEAAVVLGATGTPIPITDVYMSLQTKVVDGTENPLAQIVAMKFYDAAKHLTMTDHMIATQLWMVSNKFFDSLSPEDQAIFEETWDFIATRIEEIAEENEIKNIKLMEENGVTVYRPDKQQFMDRLPEVLERYPDWVEIYEAVGKL